MLLPSWSVVVVVVIIIIVVIHAVFRPRNAQKSEIESERTRYKILIICTLKGRQRTKDWRKNSSSHKLYKRQFDVHFQLKCLEHRLFSTCRCVTTTISQWLWLCNQLVFSFFSAVGETDAYVVDRIELDGWSIHCDRKRAKPEANCEWMKKTDEFDSI